MVTVGVIAHELVVACDACAGALRVPVGVITRGNAKEPATTR